jgi:hypothetical protein
MIQIHDCDSRFHDIRAFYARNPRLVPRARTLRKQLLGWSIILLLGTGAVTGLYLRSAAADSQLHPAQQHPASGRTR